MSKLAALLLPLLLSPLASFASVDPGLLALVPAETVVLTGVDVASAKNSDFGQFLLSRANTVDSDALSFMQQSGFDPRRDIQNFVFASFGPRQTQGRSKFAVLARGTFDQNAIASAAQAKTAITPQQYAGVTLYVNNSRKTPTAFAFPDTGIAVMGDLPTVQEIIDHLASPSALDPGLVQRVNNVGSKNDVWFASLLSGTALGNGSPVIAGQQLNNAQVLKSIVQSDGGILFGGVAQMSLDASTRSPQDATALSDVIRFLSNLVQTQGQNDPQAALLAKALENMNLSTDNSDVHVSLSVPEQDLEHLAQARPKRAH